MTDRLARDQAAARLRDLADMLAGDEEIEFERAGKRFRVAVPDEVGLEIELELEGDEPKPGREAPPRSAGGGDDPA